MQAGGKSIRGRDRVVTDGPYAESKDLVTGNLLVQADTLDPATDLARGCPIFEFDGSVEVRPVFETEMQGVEGEDRAATIAEDLSACQT